MKSLFLLSGILTLFFSTAAGQQRLSADVQKTKLEWLGEKVLGQHTGTIDLKDGWLIWQNNIITSGEFNIDMTTIKDVDNNQMLDKHLKSDDFFGVQKYPVSKLIITGSDSFEKGSAVVRGMLTIKDVTNPVEFKAAVQNKDDGKWFYANIVIDRTKFNIRYGSGTFFDNLGDKTIYDEFKVKVSLLVK